MRFIQPSLILGVTLFVRDGEAINGTCGDTSNLRFYGTKDTAIDARKCGRIDILFGWFILVNLVASTQLGPGRSKANACQRVGLALNNAGSLPARQTAAATRWPGCQTHPCKHVIHRVDRTVSLFTSVPDSRLGHPPASHESIDQPHFPRHLKMTLTPKHGDIISERPLIDTLDSFRTKFRGANKFDSPQQEDVAGLLGALLDSPHSVFHRQTEAAL